MIIINQPCPSTKAYNIFIGDETFFVCADSEDDAVVTLAQHLISHGHSGWYFDAITAKFINTTDLRYCPKHNVYLSKLKIQEVVL